VTSSHRAVAAQCPLGTAGQKVSQRDGLAPPRGHTTKLEEVSPQDRVLRATVTSLGTRSWMVAVAIEGTTVNGHDDRSTL
jgi:hypothetical protein